MRVKCKECEKEFEVIQDGSMHHQLQWCECGESAVDWEEYGYMRLIGNIDTIKDTK